MQSASYSDVVGSKYAQLCMRAAITRRCKVHLNLRLHQGYISRFQPHKALSVRVSLHTRLYSTLRLFRVALTPSLLAFQPSPFSFRTALRPPSPSEAPLSLGLPLHSRTPSLPSAASVPPLRRRHPSAPSLPFPSRHPLDDDAPHPICDRHVAPQIPSRTHTVRSLSSRGTVLTTAQRIRSGASVRLNGRASPRRAREPDEYRGAPIQPRCLLSLRVVWY